MSFGVLVGFFSCFVGFFFVVFVLLLVCFVGFFITYR